MCCQRAHGVAQELVLTRLCALTLLLNFGKLGRYLARSRIIGFVVVRVMALVSDLLSFACFFTSGHGV